MGVTTELHGGIAEIIMDNPPVNALSVRLVEELHDALHDINESKNFKFLTIRGVGDNFSAGADLKERASMSDKQTIILKINDFFKSFMTNLTW